MKSVIRHILSVAVLFCLISGVQAQSVKVNIPFWLTGSPNVGFEYTLTRQLTVNGEVLWMPYLFKKHEEVFRALQSSVELRYYVNPRNFYTKVTVHGIRTYVKSIPRIISIEVTRIHIIAQFNTALECPKHFFMFLE